MAHKQNASTHIFPFIIYILCIRCDIMRCRQFMGICKYLKEHMMVCFFVMMLKEICVFNIYFVCRWPSLHTCNVSTPANFVYVMKTKSLSECRRYWGMDCIGSMCILRLRLNSQSLLRRHIMLIVQWCRISKYMLIANYYFKVEGLNFFEKAEK